MSDDVQPPIVTKPQPKGVATLPKLVPTQNLWPLIKVIDYYEDGSIRHIEIDWVAAPVFRRR